MKFYCGIDLSARDCHVCVIDQQLRVMVQQKRRNELPRIIKLLEPYKANLKIVVESTFNWYWLRIRIADQMKLVRKPPQRTTIRTGRFCQRSSL